MINARSLRALASLAAALIFIAPRAGAQGITTAAVSGTITDATTREGIESVTIQIVNRSTGVTTGALSRAGGKFYVQGLQVGGPYSVTVRRIGYAPETRDGITLQLGQDFRMDFALKQQAAQLGVVTVEASTATPIFSPARKGVETFVTDSALRRLPTLNRNFTDFINLAPEVATVPTASNGNSAGGVNNRFNNIQIDGVSENDLFGLGSTGQPGGQANAKSISLEAVQEYQVVLSPYDVRQGNFTGALLNAVTKSGTNDLHGSAYYYFRNQNLAQNVPFIRNSDLSIKQYGFSVGGPIVKDKVHFFVAPEWQDRSQPAAGPYVGQPANSTSPVPTDQANIERFITDLQNYGLTPGSDGLVNNGNPLTNLFGRIDVALPGIESRLVARYNYDKANLDVFSRSSFDFNLSSNGFAFTHDKHAPVVQLFTNFKNGSDNELTLALNRIRDVRQPNVGGPQITVTVPGIQTSNVSLIAGAEQFSQGNALDQDIYEITDNFTLPVGQSHRITVGTHNEYFKFRDVFTESSYGVWTFDSLGAFEQGIARSYRVSASLGGPVIARFSGWNLSGYVEDNWSVNDRFNLVYGLRMDVPILQSRPAFTAQVEQDFGRRTDEVPSGNVQWSPRVGFNWDVTGDQRNQVRGGVGLFVGRPVYVWIGNSWQNSGSGLGILNCGGTFDPGPAPQFTEQAAQSPPTACANGQGLATGIVGPVDLMRKNLRYPQVLRASLSYDRELGDGFVGTLDGLYTRGINNFFYINLNLVGQQGLGPYGRVMYGTIDANGRSHPAIVSTAYSEVIDVANQSNDYSYDLTAKLQKRFTTAFEMTAAYTFSHSYDVQSLTSSRAISNWRFGRETAGDLLDKSTTVSIFDIPNRVLVTGTYTMPWKNWRTDVSAEYIGQSGPPYDYVYGGSSGRGDLNADGVTGNDLVYVPTNATDPNQIEFATIAPSGGRPAIAPQTQAVAFETLIRDTPCLRDSRGDILSRNTCRNPWQNFMNVSLNQALPNFMGRTLAVRLDIFNFLNLLNRDWGRQELAGGFNDVTLLTQVGQDLATNQPILQFNPSYQKFLISNDPANYYQLQLSARLSF